MAWNVEYTDEFGKWWDGLGIEVQKSLDFYVQLLIELGPGLRFPYCSDVRQSRHGQMRELRVQHEGAPYRILYAFDPRRTGILLIGGDKSGNDRWYRQFVPIADRLFDEHLEQLRKEGDNKHGEEIL